MTKMNQQNLANIKDIFERRTGVSLEASRKGRKGLGRMMLAAAIMVMLTLSLLAFSTIPFTPLDGDALALAGEYVGQGVISVKIQNGSDKRLVLQEQVKLIKWVGGEEIPLQKDKVSFDAHTVEPHSENLISIDLSRACDIQALEQENPPGQVYYLLLTNRNFLFGHDWICSFTFTKPEKPEREPAVDKIQERETNPDGIEEELRAYFQESYENQLPAFEDAHFQYLQTVDELLKRQKERVLRPVSPSIMVLGPSDWKDLPGLADLPEGVILDKTVPEDGQYLLVGTEWMTFDTRHHLVGSSMEDKVYAICAMMPQYAGETDGGVLIPVRYLAAYRTEEIKQGGNIFLHGRFCSLEEMAAYIAYKDEKFTFYDVTHLFYGDLEKHIDHFLTTRTDIYCDDAVRERIRNVYDYYGQTENVEMKYPEYP